MMFTLVFVIILILVAVIVLPPQLTSIYWYWKGVDTVSPLSLLGYLANIIFKKEPLFISLQHFYNTMKKNGKKFGGYYLLRPAFVPTDLDLIKKILISDFDHFTDHIGYVNPENDPISVNMFNAKGFHWKRIRSKVSFAFTSAKSKIMFETVLKTAQDFKQLMKKYVDRNESFDMKEVSERFTTDVIISYGFGIESNALKDGTSEFRKLTSKMLASIRAMLVIFFPGLFFLLRIPTYGKNLTNLFINLVEGTAKYRKQNGVVREDYMHHLLQNSSDYTITNSVVKEMKNIGDICLSLNEMAAQCYIFYAGGYETSATAISFTLTELALNQGIQSKVREEIKTILEKYNGKITYEAVEEMEYLNNCLNESLRKYPPLPTTTRHCTKSYNIPNSNVVINKGTYVFLPIYAIHRDPEHFPNPDKFDPDRFSKERHKSREPPAFLPFGDGPRKCIGYKFAILQTKVALVVLLKHFRFFPHPDVDVPLKFGPTLFLSTLNSLKINVEKLSVEE